GGVGYGNTVAFTTGQPMTTTQNTYRFYENTDALQPAVALAAENTGITITTTSPLRLRMNVTIGVQDIPANLLNFKLQVSTATSTGWLDVGYGNGNSNWWDVSWQYRRKVTFNNASSSRDLVDFPVAVNLSTSTGNIDYSKTKSDGSDLRFVASDGSTQLPYEIEKWDQTATSTVWVKVPVIQASSTANYIWMYYGNAAAASGQQATSVWDSYYALVHHMSDADLSGTAKDSTAGANDGIKSNVSLASGLDGNSLSFNGTNSNIYQTTSSAANVANSLTVSFWIKSPLTTNSTIVHKENQYSLIVRSSDGYVAWADGSNYAYGNYGYKNASIAANTWRQITLTKNWSVVKLYSNGQLISTQNFGSSFNTTASQFFVGCYANATACTGNYTNGSLDEVRISSLGRSSDWILAEYKTETNAFNTYSAEDRRDSVAPWVFYNNPSVVNGATISAVLLSTSNVQETYQESNSTALNPNAVTAGQVAEWDFALNPQNILANQTYYFRMVSGDGTAFTAYSNYPTVFYSLPTGNPPYAPSNLGPASLTSGVEFSTSTLPAFTFTLDHPDATATVAYDIQISTTSDFSGLVVDYTSALQATGTASFSVGQATGTGAYTVGYAGQVLADGSYYWRVKAVDNNNNISAYTTANSGSVAFVVNTTSRYVYWTGVAGDGRWETAGNWNIGQVPGAADYVTIGTATTVNISASTTVRSLTLGISTTSTSTILNFNYNAISAGALSVVQDFNQYVGTNITQTTGATSSVISAINVSVGGSYVLSGTINVDTKGYVQNQGPGTGAVSGNNAAGASYGGLGGSVPSASAGPVYGSTTAPTDLGSGGGSNNGQGGSGGGAVKITVTGTFALLGSISANGGNGAAPCCGGDGAGGSGGSVYIVAGTLTGGGTISTIGGVGSGWSGIWGSGSGGRIAIYYSTSTASFTYNNYGRNNYDSTYAGAGTTYIKSPSQTYGALTLDNNNGGGTNELVFGRTPLGSVVYDSVIIKNSASVYLTASSATATTLTLSNNGHYELRAGTTLDYTTLNWAGSIITDSNGTLAVLNQNQDLTIPTGTRVVLNVPNITRTYNNLTVNGTLTNSYNSLATTGSVSLYTLDWTVNGNLTVGASGSINTDAKGYVMNQGLGTGGVSGNNAAGASYGGSGGPVPGVASTPTYGSIVTPTFMGSGGGANNNAGGSGGGAIRLNVTGTTTVLGVISSNASAGTSPCCGGDGGGGSGGAVYITTYGLAGSGAVSAIGANGGGWSGVWGGGSGGRIAVYYTSASSNITYNNYAGNNYDGTFAGAGTTYLKSASQTYGDLILDNNNKGGSNELIFGRTPLATFTMDSLTIRNSASLYLIASSATATSLTLSGNGHYEVRSQTALNYSTLDWPSGILTDSDGVLAVLTQNQDLTIPTSSKITFNVLNGTRTYNNLTINGLLWHSYNSTATAGSASLYKINWTINGNLTIGSSGSINADAHGYVQNQGPGAGVVANSNSPGASYGGLGGAPAGTTSTPVYGSTSSPVDLGSGGASTNGAGGTGGGAVILTVSGNSTINGTITANGSAGTGPCCGGNAGGGSGGSIYITTQNFSGAGSLSANGAIGGGWSGAWGSGGGGRIAIRASAITSNVGRSVNGGNNGTVGTVGTLYPGTTAY
ncbi:MAG: DUF2341 domain-containing protein, partial [Patescibacteria group bacterium]|nr:DUF2341 domain-containing protein [Patescibacteria group bacterium]